MERAQVSAKAANRMAAPTEDELVTALWARNIRVFPKTGASRSLSDAELICGLLTSSEVRFQLAVIPLLLGRPSCDIAVGHVLGSLSPSRRETLACYYQAATYLQHLERDRLVAEHWLQDLFSDQLSLPCAAQLKDRPAQLEEALKATARLQAEMTGLDLNWVDTYKGAARFAFRTKNDAPSQH